MPTFSLLEHSFIPITHVPLLLHGLLKQKFISVEQSKDVNPAGQVQIKLLNWFVHIPPFLHGFDKL